MKKQRLGLFGGTFAPIHNGHLHAACAFFRELSLDALCLIPANIPPHKTIDWDDNPSDRMEMTRLAAANALPFPVTVSDIEIKRQGKSYTFDTLTALQAKDKELFFLCGTDMFLTLPDWYRGRELFQLAHMVCMLRDDVPATKESVCAAQKRYQTDCGAHTTVLQSPPLAMSSNQIRQRIRNGLPIDNMVPSPVVTYITAHHLYCGK